LTVRALIPIKGPAACKTRLRGTLGEDEREALVADMLRHVVAITGATPGIDEVCLIGPSRHGSPSSIGLLDDPGAGLNAALTAAARASLAAGVGRLVMLSADLPLLRVDDVAALAAPDGNVAIAPDRHGTGTNALALAAVNAARFAFSFGAGSFDLHCAEAKRLGLSVRVVCSPTLALDVDLPEDLDALAVAKRT